MADQPAHPRINLDPAAGPPGQRPTTAKARKPRKRHPWYWWLANLMIVCGILVLPGYFLGTCAYTALQQRQLQNDLEAANPGIAAAAAAVTATDFIQMESTTTTTAGSSAGTTVTSSPPTTMSPAEAAIARAKAEREAQLAALKAAADRFELEVTGKIGTPLGRILIPSIGVDVVMVEGTGKQDLKEGPGHWEETPFPGQGGNFVVSGHRTTYGAPFFKLDKVEVGDEIDLVLPYAVAKYTVIETLIVYPDETETVGQAGLEQVSLAACHPIYSAKQRIVVKGDLTSFKLIESEG